MECGKIDARGEVENGGSRGVGFGERGEFHCLGMVRNHHLRKHDVIRIERLREGRSWRSGWALCLRFGSLVEKPEHLTRATPEAQCQQSGQGNRRNNFVHGVEFMR